VLPSLEKLLASQPTMCRFENAPSRTDLYRIGIALVDSFIDTYQKEFEGILIDIDDTEAQTHGSQQLSLLRPK